MASTATTRDGETLVAKPLRHGVRAWLLALPCRKKRLLQIAADVLLIWITLWLAFYLRLGVTDEIEPFAGHAWLFLLAPAVSLPLFVRMGLYRAVIRYVGFQALTTIAYAITASAILLALALYFYDNPPAMVPRSVVAIYWMLSLIVLGGLRVLMRQYFSNANFNLRSLALLHTEHNVNDERVRVAIYGAGTAGNQLLMALRLDRGTRPVAFIDDNPALRGRVIAGLPVYMPDTLSRIVRDTGVHEVLLAIPSATRARRTEIMAMLAPYPVCVRTVPGFMDLASGRVKVDDLREVDITDLLGRDPVQPNQRLFERCNRDQVVMVTGAGGSIGSELCRQIMSAEPRTLVLYEQSEYNLYSIRRDLEASARSTGSRVHVVPILGSVRNQRLLLNAMSIWAVNTVYHAAAYKHVPMVERNHAEGIINNTFGTLCAAQAALQAGVSNFVLISTDKAVRPTNVMGCTKRLAEMVLQALAAESRPALYGNIGDQPLPNRTRFTMVRFGNVLDSSGSVIPLFRHQIQSGGPVTVTHREITRFFMTIPEAAQLVIQAGAMGQGGDVFVLDMGEPVKIANLAEKMIRLSGLTVRTAENPGGDIAIEYTGLRPGEKLYEELLIGNNVAATEHPMIMRANEARIDWDSLKIALDKLATAVKDDNYPRIRELFRELIDGYRPDKEMVDWVHQQHIAADARAYASIRSTAGPTIQSEAIDLTV